MNSAGRWKFTQVAADIRKKINNGEYEPGERLPSMPDLADQYECSTMVIRDALVILKQQGLVEGRQGSGTYVRKLPAVRRHGPGRYAKSRWKVGESIPGTEAGEQGRTARTVLRELATVPAPADVADLLDVEEGTPVWVRRRTMLVDDQPNELADSYYRLDIAEAAPQIYEEDTGPGGVLARLAEAGYEADSADEQIVLRLVPTAEEVRLLGLPPGKPVADLWRVFCDEAGHRVEVTHSVMHPDRVVFRYRFKIPDTPDEA